MSTLIYLEGTFSNHSMAHISIKEGYLSYTSFNNYSNAGSVAKDSYRLGESFVARYEYMGSMSIDIENVIRPTWQLLIDRYDTWSNVSYSLSTWEDVYNIK